MEVDEFDFEVDESGLEFDEFDESEESEEEVMEYVEVVNGDDFFKQALALSFQQLGIQNPRQQQIEAVTAFVKEGKSVFLQLPTGFGKSACFQVLPSLFDRWKGTAPGHHVVLVICPLVAISANQEKFLLTKGVQTCVLSEAKSEQWVELVSRSQVVFATPESLLLKTGKLKKHADSLFRGDAIRDRCVALVLDEAHCVPKWGDQFRREYGKLSTVHDALGTPVMALTATAVPAVVTYITNRFLGDHHLHIKEDPTRGNITLSTKPKSHADWSLVQLLLELGEQKAQFPRTVLFFSTFDLLGEAQEKALEFVQRHPDLKGMFSSYHSLHSREKLNEILTDMSSEEGGIRLLFASSAFGMGVDVPGIARVWHVGSPRDLDDYVQQIGRAARAEGSHAEAVLFNVKGASKVSPGMKAYLSNTTTCRQRIISAFFNPVKGAAEASNVSTGGSCCDLCASKK